MSQSNMSLWTAFKDMPFSQFRSFCHCLDLKIRHVEKSWINVGENPYLWKN